MKVRTFWRECGMALITAAWIATPASADHCSTDRKDIVDTAVSAGSFKTLAAALGKADLVGALKGDGPFTVFAPTDEAFGKLPKGTLDELLKPENKTRLTAILTYHVVPGRVPASQAAKLSSAKTLNGQQIDLKTSGEALMIDAATVTKANIDCTNGVIHVIDSVILPSEEGILETAAAAGKFKTLLRAIEAAELTTALRGDGPFTVFAPTDEAFAKLPEGTLESLLKPENRDQLAAILKYHVSTGRAFAADALKADKITTLQGSSVRVRVIDGKAQVNSATIEKTDIDARNGVIHVIDSVLQPEQKERQGAAKPGDVIRLAIERGVPLFNGGNAAACTAVYEVAAESLLNMNLPQHARMRLLDGLNEMRRTHDSREQAWILRRALDAVYSSM